MWLAGRRSVGNRRASSRLLQFCVRLINLAEDFRIPRLLEDCRAAIVHLCTKMCIRMWFPDHPTNNQFVHSTFRRQFFSDLGETVVRLYANDGEEHLDRLRRFFIWFLVLGIRRPFRDCFVTPGFEKMLENRPALKQDV